MGLHADTIKARYSQFEYIKKAEPTKKPNSQQEEQKET
jgi:hypothetical protein